MSFKRMSMELEFYSCCVTDSSHPWYKLSTCFLIVHVRIDLITDVAFPRCLHRIFFSLLLFHTTIFGNHSSQWREVLPPRGSYIYTYCLEFSQMANLSVCHINLFNNLWFCPLNIIHWINLCHFVHHTPLLILSRFIDIYYSIYDTVFPVALKI